MSRSASIRPADLRCEYRDNPAGLQEPRPRLSWILDPVSPTARGLRQTAWQVQVATAPESLESKPDLWDSGKVTSDRSTQIEYDGAPLESLMECTWHVRVWDQDGNASPWSSPARWSMGLLHPEDWTAPWIEEPDPVNFERCAWIWHPEEPTAHQQAKARTCCFQRTIEIPSDSPLTRATLLLAADDRFVLFVNGQETARSTVAPQGRPEPHTVDLTTRLHAGKNLLSILVTNATDDQPAGLAGKLVFRLEDQRQFSVPTDQHWKAAWAREDDPKIQATEQGDWLQAVRTMTVGQSDPFSLRPDPWGVPGRDDSLLLPPVPCFRKSFQISPTPKRAVVCVAAVGVYELHLNGTRVGRDHLTPGWPDAFKRLYYNVYDVTDLVRPGENVLGVFLADGWGAGYLAWGRTRNRYNLEAQLRLQLHLQFPKGRDEVIGTDGSWTCTLQGPIREADLLMGETYDARLDLAGWDTPGYDASGWLPVALPPGPTLPLEAYPTDPVRAQEELTPVALTEPKPGVHVFDLGQNMVGVVRLKAFGPRGTTIRLRHAEVLRDDGTLYTDNLRGARATDTYIKATDEEEVWTPRFTFHGFRYVEVTGLPARPLHETVTGIVLHSAMERAGEFSTSNLLVNRLYQNIVWGQKGNYLEIPTDCPQRDERLGWTGDAQVFLRTGSFNYNLAAFMTKYVRDVFDAQSPEGWFGVVAPHLPFDPLPTSCCHAWSDAAVICPWILYRVYGDTRIIERHYAKMAFYLDFLKRTSDHLIRPLGGYGDWVSLNADTPTEVLNTAYFALVTRCMAEMAAAIGHDHDASEYQSLAEEIKQAFIKAFVGPDGRVKGNTQTCYVLALRYNLLPEHLRTAALAHLVQDLAYRGGHFSTGFVGLKDLLPTLSAEHRDDLAYRLLLLDTFPSWGYEIRSGATTIWERWDGWSEELGLQTPLMNSFNHYAFGAVGEWMFTVLGGIDLAEPGYRRIRIRPRPGGDLRHARVHFKSPQGWIECEWAREKSVFRLGVRIPANTTASVHIPCRDPRDLRQSGKPIDQCPGLQVRGAVNGEAIVEVPSGYYEFTAPSA